MTSCLLYCTIIPSEYRVYSKRFPPWEQFFPFSVHHTDKRGRKGVSFLASVSIPPKGKKASWQVFLPCRWIHFLSLNSKGRSFGIFTSWKYAIPHTSMHTPNITHQQSWWNRIITTNVEQLVCTKIKVMMLRLNSGSIFPPILLPLISEGKVFCFNSRLILNWHTWTLQHWAPARITQLHIR